MLKTILINKYVYPAVVERTVYLKYFQQREINGRQKYIGAI